MGKKNKGGKGQAQKSEKGGPAPSQQQGGPAPSPQQGGPAPSQQQGSSSAGQQQRGPGPQKHDQGPPQGGQGQKQGQQRAQASPQGGQDRQQQQSVERSLQQLSLSDAGKGAQGPSQGGQGQQQGAWGGGQQRRQGQQQGGQQQQQGGRAPPQAGQAGQGQQQGAWGGGQQQQQGGRGPPQAGQGQQQGAWGGGQQQQQGGRGPPQAAQGQQQGAWGGGQQQGGRGPPQAAQGQQQGAWSGGQQQQQGGRGPPQAGQGQQQGGRGPPQAAQGQQQGAWSGGQQQQQGGRGPPQAGQGQQQGGRGPPQAGQGQQQGGRGPPQAGQGQQQGAWGGGQQQQQGGRGPPQAGQGQQQGGRGPPQAGQGQQQGGRGPPQAGQGQQQGAWGGGQQQQQGGRGPPQAGQRQQQGVRGPPQAGQGQQQGGRGPPQAGQGQQQGTWTGGQGQQQRGQSSVSNEQVLPIKAKSCSGIVRGTLGRPGELEINYLKLDLKNMPKEAYHYDVTITPDIPKKFLRPAFDQCRREVFGNVVSAYDGKKSCYTIERLNVPINHTVQVADSGNRTKEFKVEIKETGDCVVDLNSLRTYHNESVSDKPMRAIQVLDVVLSGNNHERGIRVGRSFFRKPERPFDLEDGFEAWTGLFQAAILGEQPFINVDIAHKSFPRQSSLIEYLYNQNIKPEYGLDNYQYRDVQRFLKGLDILYEPPVNFGAAPKKYRILDIGEPASKLRFKNDEGTEMTVASYFNSRGYQLKYPNLQCVKVGSTVRSISLPMELCSIAEGQALNRKDEKRQVEKMIRFAATSTNVRKEKIMDILKYFNHNDSPIIRAFGIQIGSHFIKVPMRNLPAPYMEYMNGQTVTTYKGAWRMDRMQFLSTTKPQGGHRWAIIYEDNPRSRINFHALNDFKNDVLKTSKQLNMNLEDSAEILKYKMDINTLLRNLAKQKYALVFVVLGFVGTSYAKVKQNAELDVGILTQCIKEATLLKTARDRTVFSNILLKVNAKLNGTNHKISKDIKDPTLMKLMEPLKKVMYLGADVTHPSPDQRHIPSVVGVAASHDLFGACYNMQYRLQKSTKEDIEDMESIVTRHLAVFLKYQKCYPDQILYYRDGVSDGQFPIIKNVEVRAIKSACAKLRCNPKLTVVIVVKRHHTRFFPMTKPQNDRDFNNVEPGTVVDQHITHPNEVQFFMVSHQSIQGTAKPTRYNVIVDESNFDINLLQKLTYNLCHLFPRCNRVVSYPAPAYLAHLVAFRGRVYLEGSFKFSPNLKSEYEKRLIKPHFMESNPMYFV